MKRHLLKTNLPVKTGWFIVVAVADCTGLEPNLVIATDIIMAPKHASTKPGIFIVVFRDNYY